MARAASEIHDCKAVARQPGGAAVPNTGQMRLQRASLYASTLSALYLICRRLISELHSEPVGYVLSQQSPGPADLVKASVDNGRTLVKVVQHSGR